MRILFLSPELPNTLHRIRAFNLVRGLGQHHEVDLLSLTHHPPTAQAIQALRPYCRQIDVVHQPRWRSVGQSLLGLPGAAPLEVCYEYSPHLERQLATRLAERSYDVLYVKRLRMAQYAVSVGGLPKVLDLTDAMTRYYAQGVRRAPWPTRLLFIEEWLKHQRYEAGTAAEFDRCVVASPVDAEFLSHHFGLHEVVVVPNPVDAEYFRPQAVENQPATFLLSGLMDKLVNVDAAQYLCHEIWPRVRAELPDARLRLVGPRPNRAVRKLEDDRAGIEVVGFAADLREELARATVVVVPLRIGVGTKNKVLQPLAMARPVVTTGVGNEGLDAIAGRHLEVADDPQRFAQAMIELHADPARRAALGAAGRAWVVEHHSVPVVLERLDRVLSEAVAAPSAQGAGGRSGPPGTA